MIHVIHQAARRPGHHPGNKKNFATSALMLLAMLLLGAGMLVSSQAKADDFDPVHEAQSVLDAMDASDFESVHARFAATMAAAVTADQLAQVWTTLPAQMGALESRGEPSSTEREGHTLVTIPLHYAQGELTAMFAFDAEHRIEGFIIRPAAAEATAAPPVPADATYREIALLIGEGDTALPATLTMPNGKNNKANAARVPPAVPAVVLVHGSGPHDRDETIGPNRPFLDIARGLAEHGIAVLRYDKRTKARPQDYADGITIDSETTDDALLAVAMLREQAGIDPKRIFVLGHSQGGMMAPRIATREPKIAGLILLAAPSRPLLDILIEQNRRIAILNDGTVDDAENTAIQRLTDSVAALRRGREMSNAQTPLGLPADYWHSVEAVDAVAEARAIAQPLLILQGARDIQVVDSDWQGWKEAFHDNPRVTFHLYETLNHLAIPGEGDGSIEEYQTAGHVDTTLIADVAAWIARVAPKTKK